MKRVAKPKVLVLRERRESSVAQLAMAMAWAARPWGERNSFEVQAKEALEQMRKAQGGRS